MSTAPKVPDVNPDDKEAVQAAERAQATLDNTWEGYEDSSDPAHNNPSGPSDQEGPAHRQNPPA
ncbi:hypothetical protein [Azohydromonas caseinilytica]|uniref:Uncharacterized protein n=1 Tax=Azohydromonas caseinilytica TaxID=2728836 RepID=A0A848FAH3_9BURK|nr:hypothetical protein [Azohydromonas caseinilytica]NML15866.1 hypothetical protein [Azohydromonas caseinilytica]